MGRIFALFGLCVFAGHVRGQSNPNTWHVLVEPSFMHPEVSFPIAGARTTVFVPGYLGDDGEPQYFSKTDWAALKLTWDAFCARAGKNAMEKKFHAELVRDPHKVVEYASIQSDDPLTATMILSPDFLKKFKDIFGETILVSVPNRYSVYVFAGMASDYPEYAPMILRAYHGSAYPVSLELFEVSVKGIRATGSFPEELEPDIPPEPGAQQQAAPEDQPLSSFPAASP